ncbi:hypothetical protein DL767_001227 [Monosporascus sp. MG133]|nr:hypothetical protein DL767_001227 [Monosporascus sp. MG133]
MAFLIGSTAPELQRLLVPFVCVLIAFLAYGSQWLFANAPDLAPGPLTPTETYVFNGLVCCLWWTYYKAVTVDPGRYVFPPDLLNKLRNENRGRDKSSGDNEDGESDGEDSEPEQEPDPTVDGYGRRRWCRKCAAPKPPRAHHCKTCRRCVPRMDHHCPWTANCVSLQSFPHFLRFLAYANLSLWALLYHVGRRFRGLWDARRLPAYLGPSAPQLALLTAVALAGGCAALALGILLATTVKGWLFNITMIESWELERHEAVIERLPAYGADSDGGGDRGWWRGGEAVEPVEFPYDVGIFANMAQAMGTRNVLLWFWPFAGGPTVAPAAVPADGPGETTLTTTTTTMMPTGTGWRYEENGLNDREGMWPPVDPDKVRNARLWRQRQREMGAEKARQTYRDPEEEREAFRRRQERDLMRWRGARGRILGEFEEVPEYEYERDYDYDYGSEDRRGGAGGGGRRGMVALGEGGSGWVNADGEKLGDYGVDEDAEFDDRPVVGRDSSSPPPMRAGSEHADQDDEEVPLAELIRRRKVLTKDGEDT